MKIDQTATGTLPQTDRDARIDRAATVALIQQQKAESQQTGAASETDLVELSSLGRALREAEAGSIEREEKIQELAAAVESGRYGVDPVELSRRLIAESLASDPLDRPPPPVST